MGSNKPVRNECEAIYEVFHTLNCAVQYMKYFIYHFMTCSLEYWDLKSG